MASGGKGFSVGQFLVDTSRPGKRRWCSMQRCGNLAKVRGHRQRSR
nr:CGNR zinc finger domain-containing protein [Phytoactinopolyspora halotolerans]